ncbi:MAG: hypothetical protein JOZ82_04680, partial [Marmoricola sp.]|nr:hypothetical protein [Marmoricola sp.]
MTLLAGIGVLPASTSAAAATSRHVARASLSAQSVAPRIPSVSTKPDPRTSRATHLPASALETAVPAPSGTGRRVVFSMSAQRVWLVSASGKVARTYLVSGSLSDNLHAGTYAVEGVSRWATGIDN